MYKTGTAQRLLVARERGKTRFFLESRRTKSNTSFERAYFQTNFARTMGAIEHSYQKL